MKILIFGDDKNNYYPWIKEQLAGTSYCSLPVKASNLEDAQVMLRSIYFDAIIYCINDVFDNTNEKVQELKTVARKTPVVMLTGISHFPVAVDAIKAGADTYVVRETASAGLLVNCLNALISKKLDYINRFSTTGIFPPSNGKGNNAGTYA